MILLQLSNLDKYYGANLILSKIKLEIKSGDKIALVGRNGSGKSTLLKIISNQINYDGGQIYRSKDISIGYLAQDTGLNSNKTITEELMTVFEPLIAMEKQLNRLEKKMAEMTTTNKCANIDQVLTEYDKLQVKYKSLGGYRYKSDIRSIIHGLQFQSYDETTTVASLSGGQKTRLALGKFLLSKPDILILDEPTNHLDIETLAWLEQYLQSYEGAVLIVSHDRYFLDNVVNTVLEIFNSKMTKYNGNYSDFLQTRAENYERTLKLYEQQQTEIAQLEDFIQRNIARASTTGRAQSRRRQLERMELIKKPDSHNKTAHFTFSINKNSGNDVVKITDLVIGYDNTSISDSINFNINRGESIALIGPNGIGKTTLLKTIANKLTPLGGIVETGTNVMIGYYDQEIANLSSNKTVLNELWDDFPHVDEQEIRTTLGNFLFSGDDVLKSVAILSGGEKARLALAKLYLQKANFLILDEPTNHLDLDSKEVLENALIDYPGTILFVSHDRYFINRIATKVIEMSKTGTAEYLGDYDYYLRKKDEQEQLLQFEAERVDKTVSPTEGRLSYEEEKEARQFARQRQRKITEIENQIDQLEQEISNYKQLLCEPDIYEDHVKVMELNDEVEKRNNMLSQLLDEWAQLSE